VEILTGFHRNAEGSVLYRTGGTVVLCAASIETNLPPWLAGKGKGWVTAEYQMHPRHARERREARDGRGKAPSGRTQEIQRLIGRALRAAVDLEALGERQISLDCDVLESDGGTRTASITGAFVALALALDVLSRRGDLSRPVLHDQVAAVSAGIVGDDVLLDLAYVEDSKARVDANVVATARGGIVEIQGTSEGRAVERAVFDRIVDVALEGVRRLAELQARALEAAGVRLEGLVA
jgi:ribonuclease PH